MVVSAHTHWRRGVLCALLWSGAVTLADSLTWPVIDLSSREGVALGLGTILDNLPAGLAWSLGAELPVSARRPVVSSILQFPVALAASVAASMGMTLVQPPIEDIICHLFWVNLFYGGLFAAAYHFTGRTLQLRRQLAALRLARSQADMRLREARLRALQDQIRPATLLRALRALQLRYATDLAAGNQLFETLVAFLRLAMPDRRGHPLPRSTASSMIESYIALRNAVEAPVLRWRVQLADPLAAMSLAPRGLLAALDRVDCSIPAGRSIEITTAAAPGALVVRIQAALGTDGPDLGGLCRDLHERGADATIEAAFGDQFLLAMRLPMMTRDNSSDGFRDIQIHSDQGGRPGRTGP